MANWDSKMMLRWMGLMGCALLILVGQVNIGRFFPIFSYFSELKLSTIIIFVLITIKIFNYKNSLIEKKSKKLPFIIITIFIGLLFFGISIDLYSGRNFQTEYNFQLLNIAIICLMLWDFIDNKKDYLIILNMICIASIIILFIDDRLWKFDRITIVTSISTARIILVGLGSATFLFIFDKRARNFWLIVLASYFAMTGSLKIGFIAFCFFVILVISTLLINKKNTAAALFFAAILLGVSSGYLNGNLNSLSSRVSHFVAESQKTHFPGDISNNKSEKVIDVKDLCSNSTNYQYCISDEYVIKDTTERLRLWSHAINLIKTHPYFGVGRDGYIIAMAYKDGSNIKLNNYSYPHNIVLAAAVQFGLFYAVLIILLIYFCFINSISNAMLHLEIFGLVSAGFAILLTSMTGGNLFDARYIFFMATLSLIYIQVNKNSSSTKRDVVNC